MTRRAWIAIATSATLAFVLAIALIIVIAVGGGDRESPVDAEPTLHSSPGLSGPLGGAMPPEAEKCLSEQGVEPPGSDGSPPSEEDVDRFRQALQQCGLPAPRIYTPGH